MWAERLDELEGHDEWRKRPDSLLYNHKESAVDGIAISSLPSDSCDYLRLLRAVILVWIGC